MDLNSITKEMKLELLNHLYNDYKQNAHTMNNAMVVYAIMQDVLNGKEAVLRLH